MLAPKFSDKHVRCALTFARANTRSTLEKGDETSLSLRRISLIGLCTAFGHCYRCQGARASWVRFSTRGAMSVDSRLCTDVTYCRQGSWFPKYVRGEGGFGILSLICGGLRDHAPSRYCTQPLSVLSLFFSLAHYPESLSVIRHRTRCPLFRGNVAW